MPVVVVELGGTRPDTGFPAAWASLVCTSVQPERNLVVTETHTSAGV
jgi:hypothetical protein